MITEQIKNLYRTYTGHEAEEVTELPSSGSNRRYFRLHGPQTLIGVSGTSIEENRAFIYMADHFRQKGLPVPEVYAQSNDQSFYLQEDLGDTLLFDAIEKGRKSSVFDESEKTLLRQTITKLPEIQFMGSDGFDFSYCYPQEEFNQRSILWDLNYFKYCFLKATGMEFQENRLEDDFLKMSDVLLRNQSATFMYRDFQSRNVMIRGSSISRADAKDRFIMMSPLSSGKRKRNIRKTCDRNCYWITLRPSGNICRSTRNISSASCVTSCCSGLCRYWEPTVFGAISRRSRTSYRVSPSRSRTCGNCSSRIIRNIPTCADCYGS